MISPSSEVMENLVAEATDEFLRQTREGTPPNVAEFARGYPAISRILLDLLPLMTAVGEASAPKRPEVVSPIDGVLGDFRIVRELARGGMGVVYEAQQISLERRVALKTLPFASAIDPVRLNRFKNEAQAAAQLQHQNILPVYAVGSDRGVWYYAMQIVDGRSLAEAIYELKAGESPETVSHIRREPPTALMSAEDSQPATTSAAEQGDFSRTDCEVEGRFQRVAAELCLQAAQALDHAHSMDIVHRDIKPANLMIDDTGHLWVTDFGLARVRNDAAVTTTGDVVGTLAYMSPEQAMGNRAVVDHRSDIYSLGATLYELLTLFRPFEEENRGALIRKITTEEPPSPRKLNPTIPVDLETIVLKCLASDPKDRYLTAMDLAHDLTAFLADRPIQARRPGLGERIARWGRRHRPIVILAVVALLLMVLGLGAATAMIARGKRRVADALAEVSHRERALRTALLSQDRQRQKAEANLILAEANFQQSRDVLDFFITTIESSGVDSTEMESLRRSLLEKSLAYYRQFIEQAKSNRPLQLQLARSHRRVARILFEIGTTTEAQEALEEALLVQEQLVRANPFDLRLIRSLRSMYEDLRTNSDSTLVKLVREESVQDELCMHQDQIAECREVVRDFFQFDHALDRGDPTAIRQHVRQRVDAAVSRLGSMLTPEQFVRLKQIERQIQGNSLWYDPSFLSELSLTTEQRQQIHGILLLMHYDIRDAFEDRRVSEIDEIRAIGQVEILDELSTSQIARYRNMLGNRFIGDVNLGRFSWKDVPTIQWSRRPRPPK